MQSSNQNILEISQLGKTYLSQQRRLNVLENISFDIESQSTLAIVGASGSGKTTLLGLCAGLDQPSTGTIRLNGVLLNKLNEDQRARLRNDCVGFIFQNFQLIPTLTALENVMVPMELKRMNHCKKKSLELLEKVGLTERAHHYPTQLSGGEQQRVSLARAFANEPRILFADEPTGNLDAETSIRIENLLFSLNQEAGTTLVIVTHNLELAEKTQRIIRLKAGRMLPDSEK